MFEHKYIQPPCPVVYIYVQTYTGHIIYYQCPNNLPRMDTHKYSPPLSNFPPTPNSLPTLSCHRRTKLNGRDQGGANETIEPNKVGGGVGQRRGWATNSPPKLAVRSGMPPPFLGSPYWFSKLEIWSLALLSLHLLMGSSPFAYCLFCHAHLSIWSSVSLIRQSSTDLKYSWRRLVADNSVDGGERQAGGLLAPCRWRWKGNRWQTMDNGRLKVGGGQNYLLTKS